MYKKGFLIILILLTSCSKNNNVACKLDNGNSHIDLEINATNDKINAIHVRTVFELPNSLIADKEKFNEFKKQLDEVFIIEDNNLLVKEYDQELIDKYSLSKTIEYLKKEKFYCE